LKQEFIQGSRTDDRDDGDNEGKFRKRAPMFLLRSIGINRYLEMSAYGNESNPK
jgi:hypothetical protein